MKISASSFETAKDLCMRKWWLKELRDMPEGKVIAGADFGTAIHGVNERWRRADDRGNFPPGVELYPPGWNAGLDAADTALVKLLHEKAVEQGILVRRAGRKPEEWMNTPIIVDDDVVQLTGKLDCEDNEGFEDDKSTKAAKWAKDEAGLASDAAMMFYAVEWCRRHGEAIKVRMRYNYFLKDPSHPKTWPVEALVTRAVVEHFKENELLPTVRAMVAVEKQNLTDEQWEQVEGPKTQDACRAFGGCPYATICGRVEQPAQYRARVARILSNRNKESPVGIFTKPAAPASPAPAAPASAPTVTASAAPAPAAPATTPAPATARGGIFARKNNTPPASPPTTPGPTAPVTTAPATQSTPPASAGAVQAPTTTTVLLAKPEQPAAPATPPAQAAPWAYAGCRSCKGTGMHPTEKRPCKGCRTARMVQKLPTDEAYTISYDDAGNLLWQEKGAEGHPEAQGSVPAIAPVTTPVQAPVPTVAEPVKAEKAPPRKRQKAEVAADVAPQAPTAPATTEVTLPPAPEKVLGPAASPVKAAELPFILAINSAPEKVVGLQVASIADIFAEAAKLVEEASGSNYWTLDSFKRRDALARMAPEMAARLRGFVVVGQAGARGSDTETLVQALKPHASMVLIGTN
jgi:hypothetical protein